MKNIIIKIALFSILVGNYCYGTRSKSKKLEISKTTKILRTIRLMRKKNLLLNLYNELRNNHKNNTTTIFLNHNWHLYCIKFLDLLPDGYEIKKHINCLPCLNEDEEIIATQPGNFVETMDKFYLRKTIS